MRAAVHILHSPPYFGERIPAESSRIYWRDPLSVGPVPATATLEELSEVREAFWDAETPLDRLSRLDMEKALQSGKWKIPPGMGRRPSMAERDGQLRAIGDDSSVTIWASTTRDDTLMLLALLRFLDSRKRMVSIVPGHRESHDATWTVTREFVEMAREAWDGCTAASPVKLAQIAARSVRSGWFPVERALARMLAEYPSTRNGLCPIEKHLLRHASAGWSIAMIVGETMGVADEPVGDDPLFERVWGFLSDPEPALELTSGASLGDFESKRDFSMSKVRLTDFGRRLLGCKVDYVAVNGVDRWIGGVHLQGRDVEWRYDAEAGRLTGPLV
ncbi:MAG: DUF1835 domain-containing protein [Bryobacteraceae bacterium]